MTRVALVFRTIGERTSELALELAKENIQPDEVHVLDGCRPFSETVRRMLAIEYTSDLVVAVDADCLITENMRPWLDKNDQPYVDCYVFDRFRGRLHCGVHITRVDVMREMATIAPPVDDPAYVLRPESRMRKLALNKMGFSKAFKSFRILHDHFQWLRDVFAKYALRELRSRTHEQRRKLDAAMLRWADSDDIEDRVALAAVEWAQREVPSDTPPPEMAEIINALPETGAAEVSRLGFEERGPLERADVETFVEEHRAVQPAWTCEGPVFGLGLSRTGTRSLTSALHILGVDTIHYPIDDDSFRALSSGKLDFRVLNLFDGITDITVSPFYEALDRLYPNAKFILTLRDEDTWLRSCKNHWTGRGAFDTKANETHMRIRRFLRAATYGTYDYDPARFAEVHRAHVAGVRRHFEGRPDKLLELRLVDGAGWDPLTTFLNRPHPGQPFPHKGGALTRRLEQTVDDPDD
ncbi:MAG: sulfotransferase family protein [Sandaracinaceae bacterium]